MALLAQSLLWHTTDGGVPATVTWHDGDTPGRTARGMVAYRALLAGNVDAVMRWGYNGTAAVVEERSDTAQGERGGRQWQWRRCPLLRVSEGGGRERNESAGRERASAGHDVVRCGSMWPSQEGHR